MKVLYIASSPIGSSSLNQDAEIFDIQRVFNEAGQAASLIVIPRLILEDLPREMSRHRPDVVHLSAHGATDHLVFSNSSGRQVRLTARALLDFMPPEGGPQLIYVNACDSIDLARELSVVVPHAIGVDAPLTNRAASRAATTFYEWLLLGRTLGKAYAVAARMVESLEDEAASMHLFGEHDASEVRLYRPPTIVARFRNEDPSYDDNGFQIFELGVRNAPKSTTQIVFFTDDDMSADEACDESPLESQLCLVARGTPFRGSLWSRDAWPEWGDVRLYATGVSGSGTTFTIASTLAVAIETYYSLKATIPSKRISQAISKLKAMDGADDDLPKVNAPLREKPVGRQSKLAKRFSTQK